MAAAGNQRGLVGNRRNRQEYLHKNLPKRPKRAMTAYSTFLKEYFLNNRRRVSNVQQARSLMVKVSTKWREMTPGERQSYDDRCADDKLRYAREMAKWRKQKALLTRPTTSSYALHLKAVWERERYSGRSIREMGIYAVTLWNRMSERDKNFFRRHREQLAEEHYKTMTKLANGELNLNDVGDDDRANGTGAAVAN